jgi:transcription initiation factor TFIID subunit TAF12
LETVFEEYKTWESEREKSCKKFNFLKKELEEKFLELQNTLIEIEEAKLAQNNREGLLQQHKKLEIQYNDLMESYKQLITSTACLRQKISKTQKEIDIIRNEAVFRIKNAKEFSKDSEVYLVGHKEKLEVELKDCKENFESEMREKENIINCLTRRMDNLSVDLSAAKEKSKTLEATVIGMSSKYKRPCELMEEFCEDHVELKALLSSLAKAQLQSKMVIGTDYMGSTVVQKILP